MHLPDGPAVAIFCIPGGLWRHRTALTTPPVETAVGLGVLIGIPMYLTGVKGDMFLDPLSLLGLHKQSQVLLVPA